MILTFPLPASDGFLMENVLVLTDSWGTMPKSRDEGISSFAGAAAAAVHDNSISTAADRQPLHTDFANLEICFIDASSK
jgi:hypothetical protein